MPDIEGNNGFDPASQRWNAPRGNVFRLGATLWSFILLGCSDSSYGILIPQLEKYYGVSYLRVSLVFLSPIAGFAMSTLSVHAVHVHLGQRGIAAIGGMAHVIAFLIASLHPPFESLIAAFILVGLGNGLKKSSWNSYVGGLQNSNEVLGILHGFYGIGGVVTPILASSLFTKHGWKWYQWYHVLTAVAGLDLVVSCAAFFPKSGRVYREETMAIPPDDGQAQTGVMMTTTESESRKGPLLYCRKMLFRVKNSSAISAFRWKMVSIGSVFLIAYVGVEVSVSGWVTTFMIQVRGGSEFESGVVSTGYWTGLAVGRFALGFVTGRLFKSEKHAVLLYLSVAIVMELLHWLLPNFAASATAVAFLGFFIGPIFPAVVVCISRLVPSGMRVTAIAVCSAVGSSGSATIPFMVGAIAEARGISVLQPIILSCLCTCIGLWFFVPKLPPRFPPAV